MKKAPPKSRAQQEPKLAKQIGDCVRAARLEAKLTQADVAERVGLQTEVYGRLERGSMLPSAPTLFKLGVVLGLSYDFMLGLAKERAEEARTPVDDGHSPELRRLLRNVRRLDSHARKVLFHAAKGLKERNDRRMKREGLKERNDRRMKREGDEASTQLGI